MGNGGGKQRLGGELAMVSSSNQIEQWVLKYKEVETGLKMWSSKLPVEAIVSITKSGVAGAFIGGCLGSLTLPRKRFKGSQALVSALEFSTMFSVNDGISHIIKGLRGGKEEDMFSTVVASAGSGLAYCLVTQCLERRRIDPISTVVQFVVLQVVVDKVAQTFKLVKDPEYTQYTESKDMLMKLGLEKYLNNFRKGYLRDDTLPFLTDSELEDGRIPPKARARILDHIHRDSGIEDK